ncbi:MAG: hypothetical protein ACTIM4_13345 [Marinomonas sp.]
MIFEYDFIKKEASLKKIEEDVFSDFYFKGESVYNDFSIDEVSILYKENPVDFLSGYQGEFSLINVDRVRNEVHLSCDKLGKSFLFYVFFREKLLVSDDFWTLVSKYSSLNSIEINTSFIKEIIIHNVSMNEETIVAGICTTPAATIIKVSSTGIKNELYWKFEFNPNNQLTSDRVADETFKLFDSFFERISKRFPTSSFGIGLSGGLDSRMIASLATKHSMKLVSYCVGQKDKFFIKTYGYRLARKISKLLRIAPPKYIRYDSTAVNMKISDDVYYYPWKSSNIEISNLKEVPDFDYMLNGEHGGVFFGEFDFKDILQFNKDNISEYLLGFLSFNQREDMIFSKEERRETKEKVDSLILFYDSSDRFELFYRFFYQVYGAKSKGGFFESNYNKKIRFSPFLDPIFIEFFLTWPVYLRFSRVVQYKILERHFNDLYKIQDESLDASPFNRKDSPRYWVIRFISALKIKLLTPGLQISTWNLKNKRLKEKYYALIKENEQFVMETFESFDPEVFYKENPRAAVNLVKMLVLKGAIEKKCFSHEGILSLVNGVECDYE